MARLRRMKVLASDGFLSPPASPAMGRVERRVDRWCIAEGPRPPVGRAQRTTRLARLLRQPLGRDHRVEWRGGLNAWSCSAPRRLPAHERSFRPSLIRAGKLRTAVTRLAPAGPWPTASRSSNTGMVGMRRWPSQLAVSRLQRSCDPFPVAHHTTGARVCGSSDANACPQQPRAELPGSPIGRLYPGPAPSR